MKKEKTQRSSASSRPGRGAAANDDATKPKIFRYEVDLANLPPLTAEQTAELEALAARPYSEIDTTDIPEMTEEQWRNAVRGRFHNRPKNPA